MAKLHITEKMGKLTAEKMEKMEKMNIFAPSGHSNETILRIIPFWQEHYRRLLHLLVNRSD